MIDRKLIGNYFYNIFNFNPLSKNTRNSPFPLVSTIYILLLCYSDSKLNMFGLWMTVLAGQSKHLKMSPGALWNHGIINDL